MSPNLLLQLRFVDVLAELTANVELIVNARRLPRLATAPAELTASVDLIASARRSPRLPYVAALVELTASAEPIANARRSPRPTRNCKCGADCKGGPNCACEKAK